MDTENGKNKRLLKNLGKNETCEKEHRKGKTL